MAYSKKVTNRAGGTSWTQVGQTLEGATGDYLGVAVSLSGNGCAVAASGYGGGQDHPGKWFGHAKAWKLKNADWVLSRYEVGDTSDANGNTTDSFGYSSIAMSSDGRTVAVGAPGDDNSQATGPAGYVRVVSER